MKRNMDLIKAILLFAENNCDGLSHGSANSHSVRLAASKLPENCRPATDVELDAHVILARNRQLLEAQSVPGGWDVYRLTWEGHDFLDNSRESGQKDCMLQ